MASVLEEFSILFDVPGQDQFDENHSQAWVTGPFSHIRGRKKKRENLFDVEIGEQGETPLTNHM